MSHIFHAEKGFSIERAADAAILESRREMRVLTLIFNSIEIQVKPFYTSEQIQTEFFLREEMRRLKPNV